jgi:hypothetical protein
MATRLVFVTLSRPASGLAASGLCGNLERAQASGGVTGMTRGALAVKFFLSACPHVISRSCRTDGRCIAS